MVICCLSMSKSESGRFEYNEYIIMKNRILGLSEGKFLLTICLVVLILTGLSKMDRRIDRRNCHIDIARSDMQQKCTEETKTWKPMSAKVRSKSSSIKAERPLLRESKIIWIRTINTQQDPETHSRRSLCRGTRAAEAEWCWRPPRARPRLGFSRW